MNPEFFRGLEEFKNLPTSSKLGLALLFTCLAGVNLLAIYPKIEEHLSNRQSVTAPKSQTLNFRPDTLQGATIRNWEQALPRVIPSPLPVNRRPLGDMQYPISNP